MELAHSLRPDVVLMDLRMPGMDGIAATSAITGPRAAGGTPPPKVLVLTTLQRGDGGAAGTGRPGPAGSCSSTPRPADLITAIRHCAAGEGWLDPSVIGSVIGALRRAGPRAPRPSALAALTPREREVLVLMAQGRSNGEISAQLHVSEATTRTHARGTDDRQDGFAGHRKQAVVLAYRSGLS